MGFRNVAYWGVTGLFCALFGLAGVGYLVGAERFVEGITALGYPTFVLTILGTAKVLGVIVLLAPGWPLLKEWAYAGFAFDLIGAIASHTFAGDPVAETVRPAVALCVGALSYLLRPAARRLAVSPSVGARPRASLDPA